MAEGPGRSRGPGPLCPPSSRGTGKGWAEKHDEQPGRAPQSGAGCCGMGISMVVAWFPRLTWGLEWGEDPQGAQRELEPKAHARCSVMLTPGPQGTMWVESGLCL